MLKVFFEAPFPQILALSIVEVGAYFLCIQYVKDEKKKRKPDYEQIAKASQRAKEIINGKYSELIQDKIKEEL
jgi:hypothetical protein